MQTFGSPNLQLPWFRTGFEAFKSWIGQFYLTAAHFYVKTLPTKPKKHFTFYNPDMLKLSTVQWYFMWLSPKNQLLFFNWMVVSFSNY